MVRKLSLVLVFTLVLVPFAAQALGLGNIKLNSALNQKFDAEIGLMSLAKGEIHDVRVTMASDKAFKRSGVDRTFLLTTLKFKPEQKADGTAIIRVTSSEPIREPFLNFLIEVNWPKGRLIREYTVLLDPPATLKRKPAPIKAPKVAAKPIAPATAPVKSAPVKTPPPIAEAPYTGGVDEVKVENNDSLWVIAREHKHAGVDHTRMMMAIYHTNQQAFIKSNINRLKTGAILRIPEKKDVLALGVREAQNEYKQHVEEWQADPIGTATKEEPQEAADSETASEEAKAEEASKEPKAEAPEAKAEAEQKAEEGQKAEAEKKEPAAEDAKPEGQVTQDSKAKEGKSTPDAQLKIATARPEGKGEAGPSEDESTEATIARLKQELLILEENAESVRSENEELTSRVSDLEGQIKDLEGILDRVLLVKSTQFAELQASLAKRKEEQKLLAESQTPKEDAKPEAEAVAEEPTEEAKPEAEAAVEEPTEDAKPEAEAAVEEPTEEAKPEAEAAVEEPTEEAKPEAEAAVEEPTEEAKPEAEAAVEEPTEETKPEAEAATEEPKEEVKPEAEAAVEEAKPEAEAAVEEPKEEAKPEAEQKQPEPAAAAEEQKPAVEEEKPESVVTPIPEEKTQPTDMVTTTPQAEPEKGLIGTILSSPTLLGITLAVIMVLIGLVWMLLSRKQTSTPDFQESILLNTIDEEVESSTLDEANNIPAHTEETSFLSDFSPSDIDALQDETGEVDPLSEADVYIAYGRYQQAEELIRQAIEKEPDRDALKHKLFEILYATKDTDSFIQLVEESAGSSVETGDNDAWQRVLSMGKMLQPDHPEFADAKEINADDDLLSLDDDLLEDDLSESDFADLDDSLTKAEFGFDAEDKQEEVADAGNLDDAESELDDLDLDSSMDSDFISSAIDELEELDESLGTEEDLPEEISTDIEDGESSFAFTEEDDSEFTLSLSDLEDEGEKTVQSLQDELATEDDDLTSELDLDAEAFSEDEFLASELEETSLDVPDLEPQEGDSELVSLGELDVDLSISEDTPDEIATKIDLARAYIEMGDKEGAADILDEVMNEGDAAQKEEAQKIKDSIA